MHPDSATGKLRYHFWAQAFGFVDRHLFNSLLGRRECCTFRCAEYLAAGLSELEHWVQKAGESWAGQSLEQLQHISQVA